MSSDYDIRWSIRRDMSEMLTIDGRSFFEPWDEGTFLDCLRQRNVIGNVIQPANWRRDSDPPVLGYMVYSVHRGRVRLRRLAVHPNYRRQGVGRALIERLIAKCQPADTVARVLQIVVPEDDLPTQLWLRACGIRARGVRREDDAIVFEWWPRKTVEVV